MLPIAQRLSALIPFPTAVVKLHDKSKKTKKENLSRHVIIIIVISLVGGRFHGAPNTRLLSITTRNLKQIVTLHPQSRPKKKELMHASTQLVFSTHLQFRIPCLGNGATHSGLDLTHLC